MIRDFNYSDSDYEQVVAIWNTIAPLRPSTVEQMKHNDKTREEKYKFGRFVYEQNGKIIAVAAYGQSSWNYDPQMFYLSVAVMEEHRQQGLGTAVYNHIVEAIAPHTPNRLAGYVMENEAHSRRFTEKRGYIVKMRQPLSSLDVQAFDASKFQKWEDRFATTGYTIKTLPQLKAENPDNYLRECYEVDSIISRDVPSIDAYVPTPFEDYLKYFEEPSYMPDAVWAVCDGDMLVGMTVLLKNLTDPKRLDQAITGTIPSYRRKGIATVLKLRGIEFAKRYGATKIITENEENNPMYDLNVLLGFEPLPADLVYEKRLEE